MYVNGSLKYRISGICYNLCMNFPSSAEDLHHAYIIEGGSVSDVLAKIAEMKISVANNPDVTVRELQSFGIGDARELRAGITETYIWNTTIFYNTNCKNDTRSTKCAFKSFRGTNRILSVLFIGAKC